MTQNGKMKKQASAIIRVQMRTKERLDKVRHPGQSYDGILEEVLNFWDENQPTGGIKQPAQQPVATVPNGQGSEKASWWWWPAVRGNGERNGERR